jgi:hypothetical protein
MIKTSNISYLNNADFLKKISVTKEQAYVSMFIVMAAFVLSILLTVMIKEEHRRSDVDKRKMSNENTETDTSSTIDEDLSID